MWGPVLEQCNRSTLLMNDKTCFDYCKLYIITGTEFIEILEISIQYLNCVLIIEFGP